MIQEAIRWGEKKGGPEKGSQNPFVSVHGHACKEHDTFINLDKRGGKSQEDKRYVLAN